MIELLGEISNVWPDSVSAEDDAGRLKDSARGLIDLYGFAFEPQDQDEAIASLDMLLSCLPMETLDAIRAENGFDTEAMTEAFTRDYDAFVERDAA